jgi:hypothetical protein
MSAMRRCARPCGRLEQHLNALIAEQQRAKEEQASQQLMRAIERAFHEALLALPPEEYDWFDVHAHAGRRGEARHSGENGKALGTFPDDQVLGASEPEPTAEPQQQFFEHAGSLFSVVVSPAASTDCRECLPPFQSATARSLQTQSDRRAAISSGNHRRWGHPRERARSGDQFFRHWRRLDWCDCAPPRASGMSPVPRKRSLL